MYSERADRVRVPVTRRLAAAMASGAFVGAGLLFWACGGTTGHEGETIGANTTDDAATDATLGDGGDSDASVLYDTGAFDVDITYADRILVEAAAPADGGAGADGATTLPCPGWEQVDDMGNVVIDGYGNAVDGSINGAPIDPSSAVAYIPTDFTADGGIGPAIDGGACATQRWYPDVDLSCILPIEVASVGVPPVVAPCNWAATVGNAASGPMAGQSRYNLCKAVYDCVASSGCDSKGLSKTPANCLCQVPTNSCSSGPNGPCAQQILAAFELADLSPANLKIILSNFSDDFSTSAANMYPGIVAPTYVSPIFSFYNDVNANSCLAAGGSSSDGGTN